ncbi:methyl-CpG-binding domain-containing protein 7-like isoform X1 [Populus nigra]|uniref:methyl-CpG-binding domain-containing protein 7-like isoform X1 n=1 Tax=Populus nigra TaxID=3691 RepID=UPI002B2799BB|nr:methyl-CpG-binding domain-containing protein 7-like isoform X1 [Populus nigra]XP_061958623.1 methyl-CpG-binding domain-containing protein 7-like isoform X1 [Populus nigra]
MDAKISSQNQNNELQVSTTLYHQFKLPNDWVVVRRCRSKRGNRRSHNDKYHYESGTGQRFCSLISIQKHMSGETSKSAKPGNKKNHYFEPETGKRFRSPRSVEKYLTEGKEHLATLEALKAGDNFIPSRSSSSQKEHVSRKKVETSMLDASSIPAKIKWVLSGPGGIVWNPFMDDSLVPEFIKQKWSETFVFSIIDRL